MTRVRMCRYTFRMEAPRKDDVTISVVAMDLKSALRDALIQAHQIIPLEIDRRHIQLHVTTVEEERHG